MLCRKCLVFCPIKLYFCVCFVLHRENFLSFFSYFITQWKLSEVRTENREEVKEEEEKIDRKENQFYIPCIQHTLHMANWFYYIIIHGSVALVIILEFMAVCVRREEGEKTNFVFITMSRQRKEKKRNGFAI